MSEETRTAQIQAAEMSQIDKIKLSLAKLKTKQSKFIFFVTQTTNPAASVYEIYFHATVLKNLGYSVKILTDTKDYVIPDWIEKNLTDFEHLSMEVKTNLMVAPEDVMVIPEIFTNVMEQTKTFPCIRIGLLQSVDYMLNGIMPGVDWSTFGIKNVITTSKNLKDLLEEYYRNKYNIKVYNVGIPSYFKMSNTPKRLVISLSGRNPNEVAKVIKLFYSKYPEYNFVTFDSMLTDSKPQRPLRRVDYAERLGKNFAGVWIDRIASFGTFPLECMASGTIPIGLVPDILPEYLLNDDGSVDENVGVWTEDIYAIPLLIGDVITKYLDDSINESIYEGMKTTASKYSQERAATQLTEIYEGFINDKIKLFEETVIAMEKPKTEEVVKVEEQ